MTAGCHAPPRALMAVTVTCVGVVFGTGAGPAAGVAAFPGTTNAAGTAAAPYPPGSRQTLRLDVPFKERAPGATPVPNLHGRPARHPNPARPPNSHPNPAPHRRHRRVR